MPAWSSGPDAASAAGMDWAAKVTRQPRRCSERMCDRMATEPPSRFGSGRWASMTRAWGAGGTGCVPGGASCAGAGRRRSARACRSSSPCPSRKSWRRAASASSAKPSRAAVKAARAASSKSEDGSSRNGEPGMSSPEPSARRWISQARVGSSGGRSTTSKPNRPLPMPAAWRSGRCRLATTRSSSRSSAVSSRQTGASGDSPLRTHPLIRLRSASSIEPVSMKQEERRQAARWCCRTSRVVASAARRTSIERPAGWSGRARWNPWQPLP